MHVPEHHHLGIGFSAKQLLRWGIVLLGVRLNFELVSPIRAIKSFSRPDRDRIWTPLHYLVGQAGRTSGPVPLLLAVGAPSAGHRQWQQPRRSSAPATRHRLGHTPCSVFGTLAALGLTFAQTFLQLNLRHTESSPARLFMRSPRWWRRLRRFRARCKARPWSNYCESCSRSRHSWPGPTLCRNDSHAVPMQKPWFVGGFFLMGLVNTALDIGVASVP